MKILSTNIATPVTLSWKGREELTGIYKKPQPDGVFLTPEGVRGDTIGNPRVHGDRHKACYLFDTDDYPYWQEWYPALEWGYGMFGENLSLSGLREERLQIGAVYSVGEARIRITIPREPCFKLGLRFGDQGIIDRFIAHGKPGSYAEVLQPGKVTPGDTLVLESEPQSSLSILEFYRLLYAREKDPTLLQRALALPDLPASKQEKFRKWAAAG
ncbi:MOSC domain-containing protein [Robiginitalea sp. M366]|uniref:MOSC domain-containing protein n=1 Tax=Robiginitalea aestuariiviva TaxID=3036903 RepID=UPI00240E613A|nr:MOSC domain-containing protein [Robiginitalea aestuariiviva]MDG1573191.1 MOSC domain-containing protein [Robiginitalea aestuariiviva]